jgi:cytoskeletal protein CcmA (bactofilin family)
MLKKRKNDNDNDDYQPSFSAMTTPKEPSPITPPVSAVSNQEKTVIGQHISVEGTIRGKENLVIEGSLKGTIELEKHQVTVGSKGNVEAEIHADNVTISGRLVGNIKAQGKVEVTKEADFSGEIKAKRISVEDGAYLKAVIELERESDKKDLPPSKPQSPAAPAADKSPASTTPDATKGK